MTLALAPACEPDVEARAAPILGGTPDTPSDPVVSLRHAATVMLTIEARIAGSWSSGFKVLWS